MRARARVGPTHRISARSRDDGGGGDDDNDDDDYNDDDDNGAGAFVAGNRAAFYTVPERPLRCSINLLSHPLFQSSPQCVRSRSPRFSPFV